MKEFKQLSLGEIKKVEKFAQKRDNNNDSHITGYGFSQVPNEYGFIRVRCEICSHEDSEREDDVVMFVNVSDRRRSFISPILSKA